MQEASRWWHSRWEAAGWALLAVLLIGGTPVALSRTMTPNTTGGNAGSDFWEFHRSARYISEQGVRASWSKFAHYLPSVDVAFWIVAWLPFPLAAVAWHLLMIVAFLCLLAAIHRYLLADCHPRQARQSVLAAGLLMMPLFIDHLGVGAFHILMVWWMVLGLGHVARGRNLSGGFLLGLAVWIKLLPLIAAGYLLLKRRWLPVVVAILTAATVDLALTLPVFAPRKAWELHTQWFAAEAQGAQNRMLSDPHPLDEDRLNNQSVMIVMRRTLTHMGQGTQSDREAAARRGVHVRPGDVGSIDYGGLRPNVSLANLTSGQLRFVYYVFVLLLALGMAVYCRRSGRSLAPGDWATEIALVVLSTLWFSPFVWSYHLTAATPALAVIFGRAPCHPRLAQATVAAWLLSLVLMASPTARALGVTLGMNLSLGVILLASAHPERLGWASVWPSGSAATRRK